jgi:hypothetical protein
MDIWEEQQIPIDYLTGNIDSWEEQQSMCWSSHLSILTVR